jgi:hypothetical protein
MRRAFAGFGGHVIAACIVLSGTAAPLHAQAWLPAKGEGTVSVLFTHTLSKDHFLPDQRLDVGHIDSNAFLFDVTYGISDRVAVTVGLPVVTARYRGNFPHRPITLDDGAWHSSFQDVRLALRYNAVRGSIMVTPFVGSDLPSHDYEFYTHAAPGRRLKEFQTGVVAGKLFGGLGLVVQGRYAHVFSERALEEYPRRYSLTALETVYFLTPSVRLLGMISGRIGHTGIDLYPDSGRVLPQDVFFNHDRISRESYWNVGGGAGISLTDTTDLFASFTTTVSGRNTHAVNRGLSIGVSWSFGRESTSLFTARDAREDSIVRCLCQKPGK